MLSFDYPADMTAKQENGSETINVNNPTTYAGVMISTQELQSNETFESYLNTAKETWIATNPSYTYNQSKKFLIQGKSAYNISTINQDGSKGISTDIDLTDRVLIIQPSIDANAQDQTTTEDYKAYMLILNTLQFK